MAIPAGNDKTWNRAPGRSRLALQSCLSSREGRSHGSCVSLKGLHAARWSTLVSVTGSCEAPLLSGEKGTPGGPPPRSSRPRVHGAADGLHLGRDQVLLWVQEARRPTPDPLPGRRGPGSRGKASPQQLDFSPCSGAPFSRGPWRVLTACLMS